jgi:hypothetical protein
VEASPRQEDPDRVENLAKAADWPDGSSCAALMELFDQSVQERLSLHELFAIIGRVGTMDLNTQILQRHFKEVEQFNALIFVERQRQTHTFGLIGRHLKIFRVPGSESLSSDERAIAPVRQILSRVTFLAQGHITFIIRFDLYQSKEFVYDKVDTRVSRGESRKQRAPAVARSRRRKGGAPGPCWEHHDAVEYLYLLVKGR